MPSVSAKQLRYVPLTEEQVFRMSGLDFVWDQAEAGDAMAILVRDRIRAAKAKLQPTIQRMAEDVFSKGSADGDGPSLLIDPAPR